MFDISRNQFFILGLVLLFLGIQFRLVDHYVLKPEVTEKLAQISDKTGGSSMGESSRSFLRALGPAPRKVVKPPNWLGWALISVGAVLAMHALAMRRPG